eukprot:TRINITY_DN616_c0_g1_i3.p1 TRINITY_DN616_c0_g1~~TRINITY_DN616_c0_g1_i3.p1  ORF type:complete len:305 (-),score=67.76 TRINITY_DN616_c0_g1_i3:168-1082(-)
MSVVDGTMIIIELEMLQCPLLLEKHIPVPTRSNTPPKQSPPVATSAAKPTPVTPPVTLAAKLSIPTKKTPVTQTPPTTKLTPVSPASAYMDNVNHPPVRNSLKIVLLGNSGVGKTTLATRFSFGYYFDSHDLTIGCSFVSKKIEINNVSLCLEIWDTAGQERFKSLTPMYFRGADGAILVYDSTDPESFTKAKFWAKELEEKRPDGIALIVVGSKVDLRDALPAPLQEMAQQLSITARAYACEKSALFCETSAKTSLGVHAVFENLAREILRKGKVVLPTATPPTTKSITLTLQDSTHDSADCC